MAEHDSLEGLQALHRDLRALTELKLPVLQRLAEELESCLDDFKTLLDKPSKSDQSRQKLNSGKITIGDDEYEVNDDFKQQTLEMADALDLDELQAAALFLAAEDESRKLDRTQLMTAVLRFHRRREFLLDCLRLIVKEAVSEGDADVDVANRALFQQAVDLIVGTVTPGNFDPAYKYWARCMASMEAIERWLQQISERLQGVQVIGQVPLPGFVEIMTFQQRSLTRQHEHLATICTLMVNSGFAGLENFKKVLQKARTLDRHDIITVHYVPIIIRLCAWVVLEENVTTKEVRELHKTIMAGQENDNWGLRNLHAATLVWWLSEYSGRYLDPNLQDADLQHVNFDAEADARSEAFLKALNDGAFHFILSFSQDIRPTRWYNPAKTSLIAFLLQDAAVLQSDSLQPEDFFPVLAMEQLQSFVTAFITNMPDTLRKLKVEEDDQRRRLHSQFQPSSTDHILHLERFLVIISYAYDGFDEAAADEFWADKDSNAYGFMGWAALRQPTPRIAAFCEMLRSISTGESNADEAHRFLQDDPSPSSVRLRRTGTLGYTQIFMELVEHRNDIHEPKKTIQGGLYPTPPQDPRDQIVEPESEMMLESYLHLLAHLSRQSPRARDYLLSFSEYNLTGICFAFCVDKVGSRLRAAAFDTVSALLVPKTVLGASAIWNELDHWAKDGFNVVSKQATVPVPSQRDDVWTTLAQGYDESIAFVGLLQALVEPFSTEEGLYDNLPFPENLGSSHRMPGIEEYVDFVMSHVFAERSPDVQDPLQRNVMRYHCLRFMASCLETFNENLVIFANRSSIPVDAVINSSSLAAYVKLHPFARVMEWLFNDKVLRALFASAHHDLDDVMEAVPDSPLIQSLLLSIRVMDLVMKLQATYLEIVKPAVKSQTSFQTSNVSNASLASFEDAVLNNLQTIVDLGLYCGTGHEDLTSNSLELLQKLSSSRKLVVAPAGFAARSGRSKVVGILEKDNEAERIGRSLNSLMQLDENEIEIGPEAPAYILKMRVLDFLNSCLTAISTKPTIAHVLLGFSCGSTSVRIDPDGLWANGQSLFHAILSLAVFYPRDDGSTVISWMTTLRSRCWDIIQKLWRSPLTSSIVMDELRINNLAFLQAQQLIPVTMDTAWDGVSLAQGIEDEQLNQGLSQFFYGTPALALQNFLQQRSAVLDYMSRELRLTVKDGLATLRSRIQSTLLGLTQLPGEEPQPNHNIFDMFDFIELSVAERSIPDNKLLQGINLSICQEEKDGVTVYELPLIEQYFLLRMRAFRQEGVFKDEQEELSTQEDAKELLTLFHDYNRRANLNHFREDILRSWTQLVVVMLQTCDFESSARTAFILQTLQAILPKLDMAYNADIFTALQLATLAEALVRRIDFDSTAFEKTRTGDFANDRLSQLFRSALVGIASPISTTQLREHCYQIASRYIQGTFDKSAKGSKLGKHTLSTIKNCGGHLLEMICDDAYSGQGNCKTSALVLLNAFVAIGTRQESKYFLEAFVALNFIGVLVDNIKHIPNELRAAAASQVPVLLSYYEASLALMLRICQTRVGAAQVLNAGLFQSIHESAIFGIDPDIGLEFDNASALTKYFALTLSLLRIINAAVLSRGPQNAQTLHQAREFLRENRSHVSSIFKRSVNVGGLGASTMLNGKNSVGFKDGSGKGDGDGEAEVVAELVDSYIVLIQFTEFLEEEERRGVKAGGKKGMADFFS